MREILKLVVVLSVICGVSSAALTLTRHSLADRIEKQSDLYVRGPALERLFARPAGDLLDNKVKVDLGEQLYPAFYIREGTRVTGLALEAPGTGGYAGDIIIMIGIDLPNERMLGMEIIQHSETPGVGSRVEKAGFRKQWTGLPIIEPVELRSRGGQIDAISGATYSSKAVVNGTNRIIELVSQHKDKILAAIEAEEN